MKHLYISILVLTFVFVAGSNPASAQQKVCGSVDKFNQTHRWEDLPGCTESNDYSNQTGARTLMSRAKGAFRDFFELWEKGELDRVGGSNAGAALGYMNGGDSYWNSDPELVKAKPAYEEMKRKVQQYLDWLPLVTDLAQRYIYAMINLEEAKAGDMDRAKMAVSESKKLQTEIAKIQAKSVPDDFIVPGSGTVPASTIGEIKTKISQYLKEADGSMENAIKIDNAKWEPFTKLLTGDRLTFFNQTYRGGSNVFGRGGVYLDKPEQFDTATVMCTRTWGRSGIFETWRTDCYTFRGDRRISGPRSRSGIGTHTPASAYQ